MSTLISERPLGGPSRPYVFPVVTRAQLPGGEVVAAHLPGQRMAYAGLLLEAGVVREPAGKEGVAKITSDLLREGTQSRSGDDFALALETLGASWSAIVTPTCSGSACRRRWTGSATPSRWSPRRCAPRR